MTMDARTGYCGHPAQLYGLRRVRLEEGRAGGSTVIEAFTADGLQVDILPDTGLDIGLARYKGMNASFLTKNGYDGPSAFLPYEMEFLNTFPGGLLYTCGLRNAGPPCRDGAAGEYHPQHGRLHGLRAEEVTAALEGGDLVVTGVLRESALFGHCLELRRRITIPAFESRITVEDSIQNLTPRPEEYMLLYHCNFGYPLLSQHARLQLPQPCKTTPRTEFAKAGLDRACLFDPPRDGEEERVFFHELPESQARLENPEAGFGVTLRWSGDTLPVLVQWRSMAAGDYALGLEPSNNWIMGRARERENGTLPTLGAYERVQTRLEFRFEAVAS